MSAMFDHQEYVESRGAYLLGALTDEEYRGFEAHLEGCADCRREVAALRVAVDALPASAPRVEAPPELKQGIMAIVESEAELLRASGPAADRVAPPRRRFFAPVLRRPLVAGLAATLLVLGGVAGFVIGGAGGGVDGRSNARTVAAQITDPRISPTARVSLVAGDGPASLDVRALPAPARRRVYEVWIKRGNDRIRPAGVLFKRRSGRVKIPQRLREGDRVLVTSEPTGGSTTPTRAPLIIAHLS